jgi:hypothetical protein
MLVLALMGVSNASAATEVGSQCESNSLLIVGIEGIVFPLTAASPNALPTSSPINGIATSWTVRSGSTDTWEQRLKVVRMTPRTNTVQVVAETPPHSIAKGSGPLPIRIPVQAGDRFGLNRPGGGALACMTGSTGDTVGATLRNGQPGESEEFFSETGYQPALSVTVEPDRDGDGFGDETQDGCSEVASLQIPCPQVTLAPKLTVKKRAILVSVRVSSEASVQVFGQVSWKVQAKLGQGTANRSSDRGLTVGLSAGNARTVLASGEAAFRLPLGKAVMRRLGRLGPNQALRAKLTARVTDLAGRVTEPRFQVRLRGRG